MIWIKEHHDVDLGLLPSFFDEDDPRSAREQIDDRYSFGGGWIPQSEFRLEDGRLLYPGDPPYMPLAMTQMRDEILIFYTHAFLAIIQPDGSFEVARVD